MRKDDFIWACQFVVSRCFSWYLPTTMLIPLVDMINHRQIDQCSTDILHKKLELNKDKENRKEIKYQRIQKKYDLRALMPNLGPFGKKSKKSGLVYFMDQFTKEKLYKDHRKLTDEEELLKAMMIAEEILLEYDNVHVWHIPSLQDDVLEDDDEDEEVYAEDEEKFTRMVNQLKRRVESSKAKVVVNRRPNIPSDFIEENKKVMRESFYQRKEKLFDFQIGKAQKESDYKVFKEISEDFEKEQEESFEDSDSEDYIYDQEDFPWYKSDDQDVKMIKEKKIKFNHFYLLFF